MDDKTEIDIQDLRANNDNDLLSSGIDHQKKDFHSKKFHAVSFHGFYLANTDFSQAVFQNVTFTPYSLTKADLTDAKFDPIEGTEIFSTFDLQKLLAAKSLRGISIPVRTWDNNFKHLGEVEKKEKENQFKSKIMQDYKDFFSNEKNKKTLFTIYKKILYAQTKKKPSYDENLPENRILSIDDWEEILNVAREKHSEFTQVDINNINEQEKLLFKEPKKEKGSETTNGSDPDLDDFEEVKNDENDKKEFDEPNIKLARPPFLTYNALVHRLVEENGLTLVAIVGGVGNILESARVFEDAQKNYHIFYYPGIDNDQPKNKSSFPLKKIVQLADSCIQNSFDNPLNQAKIAAAKKYYLIASDKKNHFTAIVPHGKNSHQLINSQPAVFNTNPDANYLNECGIQLEKTLHTNTQWDNWACPHYSVEAILLAYKDNEKADYSKINVTDDVAKKNIGYDAATML